MAAIKRDKSVIIIFIGLLAFVSIYWYTYNNRQSSETIVMISLNKEAVNDGAQEYENEQGNVKVLKNIDINTASVEELSDLMYVSDEQARLIIDYRNKHGDFEKVDDVYQVDGITMMTYYAVLDYTYVT